jgi:hypothetical protein
MSMLADVPGLGDSIGALGIHDEVMLAAVAGCCTEMVLTQQRAKTIAELAAENAPTTAFYLSQTHLNMGMLADVPGLGESIEALGIHDEVMLAAVVNCCNRVFV